MEDLSGKVVLVTGASKGIGAAIARTVGAAGAETIIHYSSDRAGAEESGRDMPPERRLLLQADLHTNAAAQTLWQEAVAWKGRIDVFINNAAVMLETGPIDATDEAWESRVQWSTLLEPNPVRTSFWNR